jgi:hypothetical protein
MGFLSRALDTGQSDQPTDRVSNLKGDISKAIGLIRGKMNKQAASSDSKGAGDLGEMDTGTATAKKGGRVMKTGYIKLHRGEKVIRKSAARKGA